MKKISVLILMFFLFFSLENIYSQSLLDKLKKKIKPNKEKSEGEKTEQEGETPVKQYTPAELKQLFESKNVEFGSSPDQGATSTAHSKYMGKIVFSNGEIQFRREDESKFKTSVNIEDALFVQYYLERSVKNSEFPMIEMGIRPDFNSAVLYANDKAIAEWHRASWYNNERDYNEWTTNGFPLATDDTEKQNYVCSSYMKAVAALPVGSYKMRLEMSLVKLHGAKEGEKLSYSLLAEQPSHITKIKNLLVSGEFTLNITAKGREIFLQKYAIKAPEGEQKNPVLETEIMKITEKAYKEKSLKAVILTPEWEFARNDLGILTHRYVYALVIAKKEDGTCQGTVFEFAQDKGDGNKYGGTYIKGVAGYSEWSKEYTCEAIK